jgi:hypothetical protein
VLMYSVVFKGALQSLNVMQSVNERDYFLVPSRNRPQSALKAWRGKGIT